MHLFQHFLTHWRTSSRQSCSGTFVIPVNLWLLKLVFYPWRSFLIRFRMALAQKTVLWRTCTICKCQTLTHDSCDMTFFSLIITVPYHCQKPNLPKLVNIKVVTINGVCRYAAYQCFCWLITMFTRDHSRLVFTTAGRNLKPTKHLFLFLFPSSMSCLFTVDWFIFKHVRDKRLLHSRVQEDDSLH